MSLPDFSQNALFSVKDKIVVITGGGSGIGYMMAEAFVTNGAKRVYIASRKQKALEEAKIQLDRIHSGITQILIADISTKSGCDELVEKIKKQETKIHILVNNSGITWGGKLDNFPEIQGWDKILAVNVKSIFYLSVGMLPLLSKDSNNLNPGRIINISSIAGLIPNSQGVLSGPNMGTYSYNASKAAAIHLTKTLAIALSDKNVTVNCIAPGIFPSRMTAWSFKSHGEDTLSQVSLLGRVGTPEDIGGLVIFLSSRASSHLNGAIIPIDGGSHLGSKM